MKIKERYEIFIIGIIGVLLISSVISLSFSFLNSKKQSFSIEPRLSQVLNYQKKDEVDYDTVGWIRIQGTNIDYPILSLKDKNAPVEKESYAWSANGDGEFHNNLMIMGHNILNLSALPSLHLDIYKRFEDLMGFVYEDFASENQFIQLTIDGEEYIYQIFAVGFYEDYLLYSFPTENDVNPTVMEEHVSFLRRVSFYDYDIEVSGNDDILSVITCTRFFSNSSGIDFIVSAKRIDDVSSLKPNPMVVNKNYDVVEEAMMENAKENEKDFA